MTQTIPPSTALPLIRHRAEQLTISGASPDLAGVVLDLVDVVDSLRPGGYRPRHDWGAVRLSTSQAQLHARLVVVDAVGDPNPEHVGRHRGES